ncbi:MAG: heptaprenyl diphosphate synthase component 2 [Clostridia bacterium]|nr:heptaprenyl diphosphate synthase component 2 [Clostridia bacterium]
MRYNTVMNKFALISNEIEGDLKLVEEELLRQAQTPDPVLTQATVHLIQAGGKRLRPAFAILAAKACNGNLEEVLPLAVALEMAHMATLVHDDLIDASPLRRGKPTVWVKWGQELSLHAGDYLFARSLLLVAIYDDWRIPSRLAKVSVKMVQGEILQLDRAYDTSLTLREYLDRIYRKTALLISASCELGAVVAGAGEREIRSLRRYGHYVGMAFQLTDDILDLDADPEKLGKPVGSDLRQGVITLPAIYSLRKSKEARRLKALLSQNNKDDEEIAEAIKLIREAGGIAYAKEVTRRYLDWAKRALNALPPSKYRQALYQVADFVGDRST